MTEHATSSTSRQSDTEDFFLATRHSGYYHNTAHLDYIEKYHVITEGAEGQVAACNSKLLLVDDKWPRNSIIPGDRCQRWACRRYWEWEGGFRG